MYADASLPDVCQNGGHALVSGFTQIIGIGKYLFVLGLALVMAIYLVFEFVQENRGGTDQGLKVSTFIFHHTVPVLLLILAIGLLLGFGATDLLGQSIGSAPCP
jgi:hypothetical protein